MTDIIVIVTLMKKHLVFDILNNNQALNFNSAYHEVIFYQIKSNKISTTREIAKLLFNIQ